MACKIQVCYCLIIHERYCKIVFKRGKSEHGIKYAYVIDTTLTHHGPTRSPASSPESAAQPMARSRVSAGLPGASTRTTPISPGHLDTEQLSH